MNKLVSNQFRKMIKVMMIFFALTAILFTLTSCKSVDQKTTLAGNDTAVDNSIAETTINAGTESDTSTSASGSETTETTQTSTETTESTESTSQTTAPQTQQTIEVIAKTGGYSPRKVEAKAEVPTILIMKSEGAYGCERAFNIYDPATKTVLATQILPENGQTEFDLGVQAKGTELIGVCGMGMYYFQILFN